MSACRFWIFFPHSYATASLWTKMGNASNFLSLSPKCWNAETSPITIKHALLKTISNNNKWHQDKKMLPCRCSQKCSNLQFLQISRLWMDFGNWKKCSFLSSRPDYLRSLRKRNEFFWNRECRGVIGLVRGEIWWRFENGSGPFVWAFGTRPTYLLSTIKPSLLT